MNRNEVALPVGLYDVADGRDHINTREFARAIGKSASQIRKLHHLDGAAYGIRPLKIGRDLLWPVVAVATLLAGGAR